MKIYTVNEMWKNLTPTVGAIFFKNNQPTLDTTSANLPLAYQHDGGWRRTERTVSSRRGTSRRISAPSPGRCWGPRWRRSCAWPRAAARPRWTGSSSSWSAGRRRSPASSKAAGMSSSASSQSAAARAWWSGSRGCWSSPGPACRSPRGSARSSASGGGSWITERTISCLFCPQIFILW